MPKETANKVIQHLKGLVIQAFDFARATIHIEPDFNDAAEGEGDSGGVGYHTFYKGILPGMRDASLADNKQNVILRNMRSNSASFTQMHLSKG